MQAETIIDIEPVVGTPDRSPGGNTASRYRTATRDRTARDRTASRYRTASGDRRVVAVPVRLARRLLHPAGRRRAADVVADPGLAVAMRARSFTRSFPQLG